MEFSITKYDKYMQIGYLQFYFIGSLEVLTTIVTVEKVTIIEKCRKKKSKNSIYNDYGNSNSES